jgi:hypothetical protein
MEEILEEFTGIVGYATLWCAASRGAGQFWPRTFRPDPKDKTTTGSPWSESPGIMMDGHKCGNPYDYDYGSKHGF